MARYLLVRIGSLSVSIVLATMIVFAIMHAIPGGPFDAEKAPLTPVQQANIMRLYGLDKPLPLQYLSFLWGAVRFQFGYPYESPGETMAQFLGRTWTISAAVGGAGLLLGVLGGLLLGIAAMRLAAPLEGQEPSPGLAALVVVLAALGVRAGSGWPEPEKVPLTAHAVHVARAVGEEALLAEALYAHGWALCRAGRRAEALPVLEQAAARAEAAGALDVLSLALTFIGSLYISRGEAAPARQYLDRALEVAERLDDPTKLMFALQLRGELASRSGDWSRQHAALERAVLIGRRFGLAESLVDTLVLLGYTCLYEGRWEEAERYLDESLALAEQSGHRASLPGLQSTQAERELLAGQPERAYARLTPLLDATPADRATTMGCAADWLRVRVAWAQLERGNVAQAAELVA